MKLQKLSSIKLHKMTVVYGSPGTGKTSFINTLPGKVLVIDTDKGLASLDSDKFNGDVAVCESIQDVKEALALYKDYDSIAIDHFTNVQELSHKNELKVNGKPDKNGEVKMTLQLYGNSSQTLKHIIDQLVAISYAGKNVLVICQEKLISEEDDNVPDLFQPDLMASVRSYLLANARIIGHQEVQQVSKLVKVQGKTVKKTGVVHQLRLGGDALYQTKVTRKPSLQIPDVLINATWNELSSLVDGKVKPLQKPTENNTVAQNKTENK